MPQRPMPQHPRRQRPAPGRPVLLAGVLALAATAAARDGFSEPDRDDLLRAWAGAPDTFALDDLERSVEPTGAIRCPKVTLVTHKGTHVRYHSPVRVYAGFQPRLELFESVVRDVAIEVYGRAPTRIRHLGTFNCRRIRRWPDFLSEHGLGNAIDISGFQFAAVRGKALAPSDLEPKLRRAFAVTVERNWAAKPDDAASARHSRFLQTLATRLVGRHDIFRVLLGPAYPGHHNHFHFDCAPWRLVHVFEQGA
ncbi:MAG: hypothetical protein EXR79_16240 [Myxococcales bacterium]|nr:hypothetical protein [Myxococcales bacterium]